MSVDTCYFKSSFNGVADAAVEMSLPHNENEGTGSWYPVAIHHSNEVGENIKSLSNLCPNVDLPYDPLH